MYLETKKLSNGSYKVIFWESPFRRYKIFKDKDAAYYWIVKTFRVG